MIPLGTPDAAIGMVLVLAGIGITISACEDLARIDVFMDDGVLSWEVMRVTQPAPRWMILRRSREWLFTANGFRLLLLAKAGAAIGIVAVVVLAPDRTLILLGLCGIVLGSLVLFRRRTTFGLDGSDDMMTVIFLASTVLFATPSHSVAQAAAVLYIAVQSLLSYAISGVAKLASPSWRRGEALAGVLTTAIYGNASIGAFLSGRRRLGFVLCWAVISFECLFIGAFVVSNNSILYLILGAGVLFHAATAVLMGLNGFFWAFTATYPAIIFAHHVINYLLRP